LSNRKENEEAQYTHIVSQSIEPSLLKVISNLMQGKKFDIKVYGRVGIVKDHGFRE